MNFLALANISSTSFLASKLEQTYALHLAEALGDDGLGVDAQPYDSHHRHVGQQLPAAPRLIIAEDGKKPIGAAGEAEAVRQLEQRLPHILDASGSSTDAALWGVGLVGAALGWNAHVTRWRVLG